jgi:hypothetical protein
MEGYSIACPLQKAVGEAIFDYLQHVAHRQGELERETGPSASSTNNRVEFVYRLCSGDR